MFTTCATSSGYDAGVRLDQLDGETDEQDLLASLELMQHVADKTMAQVSDLSSEAASHFDVAMESVTGPVPSKHASGLFSGTEGLGHVK